MTFEEWWDEFSKTSPYGQGYKESIARPAFEAGEQASNRFAEDLLPRIETQPIRDKK